MSSKNHDTCASAAIPIDFVLAVGIVRVPQDLISKLNFSLIDFWGGYKEVRAGKGNSANRPSYS